MRVQYYCYLRAGLFRSRHLWSMRPALSGTDKPGKAEYVYRPELYQKKKVDWVYMTYKEQQLPPLTAISIVRKSRDGTIRGDLQAMDTKTQGNTIGFLIGTVNSETYSEDKYQLTVNYGGKQLGTGSR